MTAIEKYNSYWESDEEFSYVLRMEYEWNDEKYCEMMSLVKNVFLEFKEKEVVPKSIIYFFTQEIDFISGIISNSIFFNTTPEEFSKGEYEKMVLKRKAELQELKRLFFSGDFHVLSNHTFFI